ncbi:MAG: sigma 54-interacting transcriptional regulator, partial [Pseudomonadota bacterium]
MTSLSTDPILLVEDTSSLAIVYTSLLKKAGYDVERADTLAQANAFYSASSHPLVLLDLQLPDGDGLQFLEQVDHAATRVIVITANGSINKAVEAMRLGAFDFLVKPFDETKLLQAVRNAVEAERPVEAPTTQGPQKRARSGGSVSGFVGSSESMNAIYETIEKVGQSTATVFITGESGTGKEVCARAIHDISPRRKKPFIALNCGAIPENLLESEVFGHLKGSFTGAIADKAGAAVAA